MQPWKLTLAYDGTSFFGWQVQPRLPTIQGTLAATLYRLTKETVLPQGSGRTDTGVHALAQVATFSLAAPIPPANLQRALNRALPPSIRVLAAEHADPDFHARYSAVRKTYEYRIFPRMSGGSEIVCSPILAPYVWDCLWPLDLDALQAEALAVVGEHDFSSFAAVDPDRTTREVGATREARSNVRRIERSCWRSEGGLLIYRVTGSGFLHHMVRNLVGTFVDAGSGRGKPGTMTRILAARQRSAAGPTAPARGLFLHSVEYGQ